MTKPTITIDGLVAVLGAEAFILVDRDGLQAIGPHQMYEAVRLALQLIADVREGQSPAACQLADAWHGGIGSLVEHDLLTWEEYERLQKGLSR